MLTYNNDKTLKMKKMMNCLALSPILRTFALD